MKINFILVALVDICAIPKITIENNNEKTK
jgi:hypothetical protein